MKLSSIISIATTTALSMSVSMSLLAGEDIDRSMDAASDGLVEIKNVRGEVTVNGWNKNSIRIEGELDDLTEELVFEVDGKFARIDVRIPNQNINWGGGSDLEIFVPERSRVKFEGVSSDATVHNVLGGIKLRTASGDIKATEIAEQINVKTVSGDIVIRDSAGQANVSSVSGEITLNITSQNLMLDTVSGDVEATLRQFDRLLVNAVSGDIEVEGTLAKTGKIDISTISSDVSLGLSEPVHANISIKTGPGGDITNYLSEDEVQSQFPAISGLSAELGDGTAEIQLRTVTGDITLDSID